MKDVVQVDQVADAIERALEPFGDTPSVMISGVAIALGVLCGTYMRNGQIPADVVRLAQVYADIARVRIQPILLERNDEVAQAMLDRMHLKDKEIH